MVSAEIRRTPYRGMEGMGRYVSLTLTNFVYLPAHDEYRCPAGQHTIKRFSPVEADLDVASGSCFWRSHVTRRQSPKRTLEGGKPDFPSGQ